MSEEKKESWLKRAWKRSKKYIIGLFIATTPTTVSANPTANASPESPNAVKIGLKISTPSDKTQQLSDSVKIDLLTAEINDMAIGIYKDKKLDLTKIQSHEIGGLFESNLDPCAKTSNYVGICQLNRNNTLPKFIREYCAASEHFKSLAKFKTARACHTKEFDNAWDKVNKGPHAKEFTELQNEALFKYAYENTFNSLAKTGFFPEIKNSSDCETLDHLIYAAGVKSSANQNPWRTAEIYIRTFNDMCVEVLTKQGIKAHTNYQTSDWLCYKSKKRGGTKKYNRLVSDAIQEMHLNFDLIRKYNVSIDLSIENITLQTYKTKTKAFGEMGNRYREDIGEAKLIKDLILFVKKQKELALLKSQKERIQEFDNQKINVSGFYALSSKTLQQQIDLSSNELTELTQTIQQHIEQQKIQVLKKAHNKYKNPIAYLMAEAKAKANAKKQQSKNYSLANLKKDKKNGNLARARAAVKREQQNNEELLTIAQNIVDSSNNSLLRPEEITLTAVTTKVPQTGGNPPILENEERKADVQMHEKTEAQIKKEKQREKKLEKMYKYNAHYRKAVDDARAARREKV